MKRVHISAAAIVMSLLLFSSLALFAPAAMATSHLPADGTAIAKQVKLLYFHRRFRCPECERIEAGTRKALQAHFPKALKEGRLVMEVINLDEPGNEHYTKDYNFFFNTIIVVNTENGSERGFKNLEDVWKIYEDEQVLSQYIKDQVGDYLVD